MPTSTQALTRFYLPTQRIITPSNVIVNTNSIPDIETSNIRRAAGLPCWGKALIVVGIAAVFCAAVAVPVALKLTEDTETTTTTTTSTTSTSTTSTSTSTTSTTSTTTSTTSTTSSTTSTTTSTTSTTSSTTSTTTSTTSTTTSTTSTTTSTTSTTSSTTSTTTSTTSTTSSTTSTTTSTTSTTSTSTTSTTSSTTSTTTSTTSTTSTSTTRTTSTTSSTSTSTTSTTSTSSTTTTTKTTTTSTTTTTTTSVTTTTTTSTTTTTPGTTQWSAFWQFDSNCLEMFNSYNGVPYGTPSYTTSVLGHGAAISFTASSSQYVTVTTKQVPFNSTSFTIEAWLYPISLTTADTGLFGQCQSTTTSYCLHFTIRNLMLYCGFYANDLAGSTTLTMNQWSHVACVYDLSTTTQQVWLNGVLDGTRTASPYLGSSGPTTIGMVSYPMPSNYYFNGYIDQVRYEPRAKYAYELLNDATLCAQYSFDGGSLLDSGPNGINGTLSGSATTVTGRSYQALQFSSGSYFYVSYTSFYFLGVSNYPFTVAMWVKPTGSYASSTVFFVNAGWCVSLLTMTSSGNIIANLWNGGPVSTNGPILPLNTWNHIGYTYSSTNGIRLYVNGTLYSTTGAFSYSASGALAQIVLAGNLGLNGCSPGYGGSFTGALDEFYLYSRELTASQISVLANP